MGKKLESAQKSSLDQKVTNYILRKILFKLNLLNSETSADLSNYVQNGEWDLVRSKIFTINMLDVWPCNMCKRNLIQTVLLGGCRSGEKCCLLLVL